jgi:hypothetical protein
MVKKQKNSLRHAMLVFHKNAAKRRAVGGRGGEALWSSPAEKTFEECKTLKVKQKLPGTRNMITAQNGELRKNGCKG